MNVSNPKMPIFYMALLPGLVGTASLSVGDVATLLAVVAGVEILVIGGHVLVATRARRLLSEPRTIRRLNRGAGNLKSTSHPAIPLAPMFGATGPIAGLAWMQ